MRIDNKLYYECNICKQKLYLDKLYKILWANEEKIIELARISCFESWEPLIIIDRIFQNEGGNIVNFQITEPICKCTEQHYIIIYVKVIFDEFIDEHCKYEYFIREILDFIPLTSKTLSLRSGLILLKGKEILELLHWFFERWAIMRCTIEIVSPFIDIEAYWKPLYQTVMKFRKLLHEIKPFIIYTRKTSGFFKKQKTAIERLNDWLQKESKNNTCSPFDEFNESLCHSDLTYPCTHSFAKYITQNVYYLKTRFHAKYYMGSTKSGFCEAILTSFNLIKSELNQYESFILTNNIGDIQGFKDNIKWKKIKQFDIKPH
ncbi:MAG: hypothetical protein HZR80_02465 [Candidatus Heimdallarchaeota archaeon]